jgi:hypothetical protein
MRKSLSWPVTLVALVSIGVTVAPALPASAAPVATAAAGTERDRQLREQIIEALPAEQRSRLAALKDRLDVADDVQRVAEHVINPDDYVCASTDLLDWLVASTADWTADDFANVELILQFSPALFEALLMPEPAAGRYFGVDGEYTGKLQRSFRNLKNFWDIEGDDIELVPLHGSTLRDSARIARFLQALGTPEAEAVEAAEAFAELVNQPQYDYGDHPIFTFNAFAFPGDGAEFPGIGVITDKIIMGDGILEGFAAIGLSDVAPNAVLGHEYGHHIQFERNLFESPLTGAEATRRTELMADSFSTYWASHKRGDNLRWNRTRKALQTFYNLGDCAFEDASHHGTPNQRLRAADWGNDVADRSRPPTRILPSATFARLFEKKLPTFVAPDAG